MANITGIFLLDVGINKEPRNNVKATLCAASGFTTPPQKNTAIPSGAVIASVTTGTQYGGDGQYAFYNVSAASGGFYVALQYAGSIVYDDHTGYVGGFNPQYAAALTLFSSYTPSVSGADTTEMPVPYSPLDGTTTLTFNIRRIDWRAATSGSTSGSITIQKSTVAGAFNPSTVGTVTLPAAAYEASSTASLGTVQSGEKLRANFTVLPTGAQSFTVNVELGT